MARRNAGGRLPDAVRAASRDMAQAADHAIREGPHRLPRPRFHEGVFEPSARAKLPLGPASRPDRKKPVTVCAIPVFGGSVRYSESMETVEVRLPADLVRAAGLNPLNPSTEASQLLALELYREDKVSLGRAAELCQTPVEQFLEFAGRHNVPVHYGFDQLEEDRCTLERLGL